MNVDDLRRGTACGSWASCVDRLGEPVRGPHRLAPRSARTSLASWLPATQSAVPASDHRHHPPQHARGVRAAVDQVAHEDGGPAVRVRRAAPSRARREGVELRAAAVDVTDEVVGRSRHEPRLRRRIRRRLGLRTELGDHRGRGRRRSRRPSRPRRRRRRPRRSARSSPARPRRRPGARSRPRACRSAGGRSGSSGRHRSRNFWPPNPGSTVITSTMSSSASSSS